LISFAAQIVVIWMLFANIDFLGGGLAFANWILWINLAVIALGIVGALWLKSAKPQVYDQLGRLLYEGLAKE
jgi:hypothetical protein